MLRGIAEIVVAIQIANPHVSDSTATSYAKTLQKVAVAHHFDPYTAVSIGRNESQWNARLVGGAEGKCHGLFQDCVQWTVPACRGDLYESAACRAERSALLNGQHAIRTLGKRITQWRKYCRRKTGRPALFARWLAGYQGVDAARGTTCNQRKVRGRWKDASVAPITSRVMRYRRMLIREVPKRRRRRRH